MRGSTSGRIVPGPSAASRRAGGGRSGAAADRGASRSIMAAMALIATLFSGHPVRIGGAAVMVLVLAGLAWYLGSPLFVRTYTNEALPAPTSSGGTTQPTVVASATLAPASPRILSMGELGYVDSIHNGKGPVRIVD